MYLAKGLSPGWTLRTRVAQMGVSRVPDAHPLLPAVGASVSLNIWKQNALGHGMCYAKCRIAGCEALGFIAGLTPASGLRVGRTRGCLLVPLFLGDRKLRPAGPAGGGAVSWGKRLPCGLTPTSSVALVQGAGQAPTASQSSYTLLVASLYPSGEGENGKGPTLPFAIQHTCLVLASVSQLLETVSNRGDRGEENRCCWLGIISCRPMCPAAAGYQALLGLMDTSGHKKYVPFGTSLLCALSQVWGGLGSFLGARKQSKLCRLQTILPPTVQMRANR